MHDAVNPLGSPQSSGPGYPSKGCWAFSTSFIGGRRRGPAAFQSSRDSLRRRAAKYGGQSSRRRGGLFDPISDQKAPSIQAPAGPEAGKDNLYPSEGQRLAMVHWRAPAAKFESRPNRAWMIWSNST